MIDPCRFDSGNRRSSLALNAGLISAIASTLDGILEGLAIPEKLVGRTQ